MNEGDFNFAVGMAIGANRRAKRLARDVNEAYADIEKLLDQRDELLDEEVSLRCALAGARATIRELKAELQKLDPSNPLLKKEVLDEVYDKGKNDLFARIENKPLAQRKADAQEDRDLALGNPGSTKSGHPGILATRAPFLQGILAKHGLDRHVPAVCRTIGNLVEAVYRHQPDAPVLKDESLRQIFTEYQMSELEKFLPKKAPIFKF